ncbi:MAG: hypothetical protein OZSIB_0236 [Candidatus Ozemobacter sibiricus]|uniref:Uncharacterized protein n=1 Tax=Candidatus Ozemobacter sibiricus TaxID=2268124 RepID=A0A367ZP08_9BACT|nr:MAG: hypothetical protein OZSIB_0236 [Candidatus Ozemobacter sibiricus]
MTASAFETCLLKIESTDPAARQEGVLALHRIPEPRSLQVLQALIADADPVVREYAIEGVNRLVRAGVRLRKPRAEPRRECATLRDALDVADEVFCIFRRNAAAIMAAALVAGVVKILIGAVFLLSPYVFDSARVIENSLGSMGPALLVIHQLFLRPFAWLTVGRAFMGGFLDPVVRQQARVPWQPWEYWAFFPVNLVQALPICFFAWVIIAARLGGDSFWLAIALLWWVHATLPLLPLQLINAGRMPDTLQQTWTIWWERAADGRALLPTFLIQLGLLYLLIFINVKTFVPMPWGFDFIQSLGTLLLADALLDPFWIGYRILVTRLLTGEPTK